MVGPAIHRLVEYQAAARGDALAYIDESRVLTYRDLNSRANNVARALMASGFRRGSIAAVRMPRSPELVTTLLAILKAGGAYRWVGEDRSWPAGVSLIDRPTGSAQRCLAVDLSAIFAEEPRQSPNLPIMTRGTEIACVLGDVLVPHATVSALHDRQVPGDVPWSEESGALDLWLALMTGATLALVQTPQHAAAA
jgi:hypothetical protein